MSEVVQESGGSKRPGVASACTVCYQKKQMPREYGGPAEEDVQLIPMSLVHIGGALYFSAIEGRNQESKQAYPEGDGASPSDIAILEASSAFDFSSRAIKTFLIDSFFKYCYPWPLLVQAVLLAGSRVVSMGSVSSQDLYMKAKALFHSNQEKNPIILIIACLLLQWWNSAGPERISLDSSVVWQRTGDGIATSTRKNNPFRRWRWWSLAARYFQISAAHGRPKAIQTEESTVPPLTIEDFRQGDPHASFSVN
ncbi:unnamed protein product [Clonostachys rhizophaga]|uniref:Uncharacterized protein n=1 Tax=Clonostachys rhizophaga TaxID=160324 RepID=A0A9N9VPJ4_9HYPO|nr:unnamed protein product [Clonostachys rhizophaga]